jgi:hypothetical protein
MTRSADIAERERRGHEFTMPNEDDDYLGCRLAMLGLDLQLIKRGDSDNFELIRRRCTNCASRDDCAVDLKRDPNNPVWQTYCPNAGALIALSGAKWLAPIISSYWRRHYPLD